MSLLYGICFIISENKVISISVYESTIKVYLYNLYKDILFILFRLLEFIVYVI